MTLVILAAGMGSRYGGLKQLDPITGHGEFILDFSVFDAKRAGFDKVVFIIKKETEELFRETVGNRIAKQIKVEYVYQSTEMLPAGAPRYPERVKPWGTGHALLCAKEAVGEDNLMVINADDFYGKEAYTAVASFLEKTPKGSEKFCMAGFVLKNTLTESGSVSRGICESTSSGELLSVTERTKIYRTNDGRVVYEEDGVQYPVSENAYVSMNCWGFTSKIFSFLEEGFLKFLGNAVGDMSKKEFYLPFCVDDAMKKGLCSVKLLPTGSKWYGVTYPGDKPKVVAAVSALCNGQDYPDGLFQ